MIVMKFGGSSLGSAAQIKSVGEIVAARLDRQPVVVVSAVGGTTDLLLAAFEASGPAAPAALQQIVATHREIINALWPAASERQVMRQYLAGRVAALAKCLSAGGRDNELRDRVVSFGETLSSYIVAAYLNQRGLAAQQVVASDIVVTDSTFGAAEVIEAPTRRLMRERLSPLLSAGTVPVVTGFIGADGQGRVTTLGRGGSDYSAAIIGFFLEAEEIQIWTDVDGLCTTDPRLVDSAQPLRQVSFREAAELAAFGAKILHPKTIRPAASAGIPVRIQNSFRPESTGTLITQEVASRRAVTAIACKPRVTTVNLRQDVGIVTLVGTEITRSPSTLRTIFRVLDREGIAVTMASLGASELTISLVVPADAVIAVVRALHDEFIPAKQGVLV